MFLEAVSAKSAERDGGCAVERADGPERCWHCGLQQALMQLARLDGECALVEDVQVEDGERR